MRGLEIWTANFSDKHSFQNTLPQHPGEFVNCGDRSIGRSLEKEDEGRDTHCPVLRAEPSFGSILCSTAIISDLTSTRWQQA